MPRGSAVNLPARSYAVPWSTLVRMIGRPSETFTASPKLATFIGMVAWSWYIATTPPQRPASARRKALSAGTGPSMDRFLHARRLEPRAGLRDTGLDPRRLLPAEQAPFPGVRVERGDDDPRRAVREAREQPGEPERRARHGVRRDRRRHARERQVGRHERRHELGRPEAHDDLRRAQAPLQVLGVPEETCAPRRAGAHDRLLAHGTGGQRVGSARGDEVARGVDPRELRGASAGGGPSRRAVPRRQGLRGLPDRDERAPQPPRLRGIVDADQARRGDPQPLGRRAQRPLVPHQKQAWPALDRRRGQRHLGTDPAGAPDADGDARHLLACSLGARIL